jgi:hypothetical protein
MEELKKEGISVELLENEYAMLIELCMEKKTPNQLSA